MNRIDRLHAIVTVLQSKRVVRAEDLATRFQISLRTVYRDIKALEEGGIPIGAEAGVGYFLSEGYHLPPVMFTHEEARTILLAGKILEKFADRNTNKNFDNALTKIRAVLDLSKNDELDGLENKIVIDPFRVTEDKNAELFLEPIKRALINNQVIRFNYVRADGEMSERIVEPIGITFYYSTWHLISFCRLRKEYRDFRLDRMSKLLVQSERFQRIKHPSLQQYLDNMAKRTELVYVTIRVPKATAKYIQESKYNMGLVSEQDEGDKLKMEFATYSYRYMASWLMMLGEGIEIAGPEEMTELMKKKSREVFNNYNGGSAR